jgi:hypothetical protein
MFKYLFTENCVVYEIMWKNVRSRQTTHDIIIQHMRFACWLDKARGTRSEYVQLSPFPCQQ